MDSSGACSAAIRDRAAMDSPWLPVVISTVCLRRIVLQLLNLNQCIIRHIDIAKLCSSGDDIDHAASLDDYFSVILISRINNLLHTVYIGCERCNDNSGVASVLQTECQWYVPTVFSDWVKPGRSALVLSHISASTPFFPISPKRCRSIAISVYRRIIYLKVSGVYNSSCRRINRQSGGIRNTVVGLDKLYPELPEINGLSVAVLPCAWYVLSILCSFNLFSIRPMVSFVE